MRKNTNLIGLWSCVGILVGGMIGSALFSLTGITVLNAGSSAIISWIMAAVLMLAYGIIISELAGIVPKTGGVFLFPAEILGKKNNTGKLWGWVSTWGFINSNIVAIAFSAIYVGLYLEKGFPELEGKQVILAVVSILLVFCFEIFKLSVTKRINNILVIALVITLLTFIAVAFFGQNWDINLLSPFFSQGVYGNFGFLTMVPVAMIGYGSIVTVAFMASEVKNPEKNIPKSMIIAIAIVCLLYVLIVLSILGSITAQYLLNNPDMQYIPLYAVAFEKLASVPWLSKLISISAVLALITTIIAIMSITARTVMVCSEQKLLPFCFAYKNKSKTPVVATAIVTVLSIVISLFPQFTSQLVELATLFSTITIVINCVSLFVARRDNLDRSQGRKIIKSKAFPIITMLLIIICYLPDIIKGNWQLWLYTSVWYLLGFIIFIIAQRVSDKKKKTENN